MPKKDIKMSDADQELMRVTAENIANLMKDKGVDAVELSKATGLGIATINSIRRAVGNPTLSTLSSLANFFGVSLAELTEKSGDNGRGSLKNVKPIPFLKVGDVESFFSTGHFDDTYTTEIEVDKNETFFAVQINNDTMHPQMPNGSVCIVSKDAEPSDGDIVLVKIYEHTPCFRRVFIDGSRYMFTLISLDRAIAPSLYDNYKILGVVLKSIKVF
ncbi:S24 family peptidase [Klebsiella michiganensis]|uniref:S24 family peptidase n=1 Tax=Klebsiella michiganensis TaxID=1134687 RepID=UPI003F502CD0